MTEETAGTPRTDEFLSGIPSSTKWYVFARELEREVAALTEQLKESRHMQELANERLKDSRDILDQREQDLIDQCGRLRDRAEAAEAQRDELHRDIDELVLRNQELERGMERADKQFQSAEAELDAAKRALAEAVERCAKAVESVPRDDLNSMMLHGMNNWGAVLTAQKAFAAAIRALAAKSDDI